MKTRIKQYHTAEKFGRALGLSRLDMQLIREKKGIVETLKTVRVQKGMSQRALAEIMGSTQPAIARMESGQLSEVSMDFLVKAALALHVSLKLGPSKRAA